MPFATIYFLWCSYQLRKHEEIEMEIECLYQSTLDLTFSYMSDFWNVKIHLRVPIKSHIFWPFPVVSLIIFSSLTTRNTFTRMRTFSCTLDLIIWSVLTALFSDFSLHLPSSPDAKASEARPTDLQLQAVHREVLSPHHAGRSDTERNRSRSLPADCQEHQREVRQPTHWPRMLELVSLPT